MGEKDIEVLISRRLDGAIAAQVTRVVAAGRKKAASRSDTPVTTLAHRLSSVGRVSARRLSTASRDREARTLLFKDMSTILTKDPALKQAVTKWATGQAARKRRNAGAGRKAVSIGEGGGSFGKPESVGGGGGRLDRAALQGRGGHGIGAGGASIGEGGGRT